MSFVIMHKTIGAIAHMPSSYFFAIILSIILILFFLKLPRIDLSVAVFVLYIGFSLLILNPPSLFRPWSRYILFLSVISMASPLFQSWHLRSFRISCLRWVLTLCVIVSIISFVFYFLGINFMRYTANLEYSEKGGLFGGFTNHSIVLGIISGISICLLIYKVLTSSWKWLVLAVPCIGSLLFSASRGALAATIIGVFVIIVMTRKLKMAKTNIWFLIPIAIIGMWYVANYTDMLSGLQSKLYHRDSSSIFSSREDKITYRIEEFISSPLIGIGFSTISLEGGDEVNRINGTIEPGSSWLALLSMTGILGALLFLLIFYKCYRVQMSNKSQLSILLLGLLSFFAISMLSEGYIFAAGSPLCFILWLVIGNSIDSNYRSYNKIY